MSIDTPQTPTRSGPNRAALVIALCLFALGCLIFWDTSRLSAMASYARIGPATVPNIIAGGLVILALCTGYTAFRGGFPEMEQLDVPPVLWVVAGLVAQLLLLKPLGFSIATGLLFALTARGFGKRKLWFSIPIGIVICFVVWIIFSKLLQLSLPAGPLERLFFS